MWARRRPGPSHLTPLSDVGTARRRRDMLAASRWGGSMTSLLVHAALGVATVVFFFIANAHLYRRDWPRARVTPLEGIYYATAIVSVCIGWYFNQKYVFAYPEQA